MWGFNVNAKQLSDAEEEYIGAMWEVYGDERIMTELNRIQDSLGKEPVSIHVIRESRYRMGIKRRDAGK